MNYNSVFQLMDDIFSNVFDENHVPEATQPVRFNKVFSSGDYPPTNIIIDNETKELTFEVALAGYSEENINLSFETDRLKLKVEVPKLDSQPNTYIIQHALRMPRQFETSWAIDPRFYDRDSVKVSFVNGLLTIKLLPRIEVAPKKISLFGKLQDQIEAPKE